MNEIAFLQLMLDEAFEKKSWHGPNLRGAVRRVEVYCASWKPSPERKSIWEHMLHAAYWKYVITRRIMGSERGAFPLKGSDWFDRTGNMDAVQWTDELKLLVTMHKNLIASVGTINPKDLDTVPDRSKTTHRRAIFGIAFHDVYHAGQIQLLKRLYEEEH